MSGPTSPSIAWTLRLRRARGRVRTPLLRQTGIVVGSDGVLRVTHAGTLTAVTRAGEVTWSVDLVEDRPVPQHSAPLALARGRTAVTHRRSIGIYGPGGEVERRAVEGHALDDSGTSPSVTPQGELLVTEPIGDLVYEGGRRASRRFPLEFDHPVPPTFADGSVLVRRQRVTRLSREGTTLWEAGANGLPSRLLGTLARDGRAAIGDSDKEGSRLLTEDGDLIGIYHRCANFSEAPGRTWVALASDRIARVTDEGEELWSRAITPFRWRKATRQAIVDRTGRAYVLTEKKVLALDPDGTELFCRRIDVKAPVESGSGNAFNLALVGEGALAVAVGDHLHLLSE